MADKNNAPNARFDHGPAVAGGGRASTPSVMQAATVKGVGSDGAVGAAELRTGYSAAGVPRNNGGPNVAGNPRSVNGN